MVWLKLKNPNLLNRKIDLFRCKFDKRADLKAN